MYLLLFEWFWYVWVFGVIGWVGLFVVDGGFGVEVEYYGVWVVLVYVL